MYATLVLRDGRLTGAQLAACNWTGHETQLTYSAASWGGKARGREWAGAREGVERELAVTTRDGEGEEVADGAAGRRDTDTNKHARIRRRRTECARWWSYHRALGWPRWDCMQWVDRGLQLMLVPAGAG